MFNWFKRKPKCYGDYKWETKCEICEYVDKCIDFTNTYRGGTRFKLTNDPIPNAPHKQLNKTQMTLDEAIVYCIEQAGRRCDECSKEYYQLALWLQELKEYRDLDNNK